MLTEQRAVVVTGTSTGIGRACARRLAREGFTVFATARRLSDLDALRAEAPDRIIPIQLDVTDRESIRQATRAIEEQLHARGCSLSGLVNNAGIGLSGPVECLAHDSIRQMFDVNVLGQVDVTQSLLPLLRETRGRVVNICSIGDRIAIPFGGVLNATKSAFAMISESLRLELRPWGLRVVIIEPAAINTPAVDKTLGDPDELLRRMSGDAERLYGPLFREFTARAATREHDGSPPDVVADVVLRALRDARPKRRYIVGKHARVLSTLARIVPAGLLDRLRMHLFGLPTKFGALASPSLSSRARAGVT